MMFGKSSYQNFPRYFYGTKHDWLGEFLFLIDQDTEEEKGI
jgi:hypothetical protein